MLDNPTLDVVQASGARSVLLSADAVTGRARSGVVSARRTARHGAAHRPAPHPRRHRALGDPDRARPRRRGHGRVPRGQRRPARHAGPARRGRLPRGRERPGRRGAAAPVAHRRRRGTGAARRRRRARRPRAWSTRSASPTPPRRTPPPRPVRPDPPVDAAEVPGSAVSTLADAARDLTDLRSAVVDGNVGITADQLFAPLQFGLLRGASAAYREAPAAAQDAASAVLARVDAIRNSIRVLEPPNPYALGSSDAPLPITVANALPVTVRVRVELASTSGLRVNPIDVQQIPPLGRRQVSVNAQVTRAGQFTVDAAVRTPAGGLLGPPSHLKVRSTAYGTITGVADGDRGRTPRAARGASGLAAGAGRGGAADGAGGADPAAASSSPPTRRARPSGCRSPATARPRRIGRRRRRNGPPRRRTRGRQRPSSTTCRRNGPCRPRIRGAQLRPHHDRTRCPRRRGHGRTPAHGAGRATGPAAARRVPASAPDPRRRWIRGRCRRRIRCLPAAPQLGAHPRPMPEPLTPAAPTRSRSRRRPRGRSRRRRRATAGRRPGGRGADGAPPAPAHAARPGP